MVGLEIEQGSVVRIEMVFILNINIRWETNVTNMLRAVGLDVSYSGKI